MDSNEKDKILEDTWGIMNIGPVEYIEGLENEKFYVMEMWGVSGETYFKYKESGTEVEKYGIEFTDDGYKFIFDCMMDKKELVQLLGSVFVPNIVAETDVGTYIYYYGEYVGVHEDKESYNKRLDDIYDEFCN